MKTSYFGFIKDIDDIAAAGYDCVELHIKELMSFDEAEYTSAKKKLRDSILTAEVFDNPLPLDVVIDDEGFDEAYYTEHLKKVMDRAAGMGARFIVYGNGKTRSLKTNGDSAKNDRMIAVICDLAAQANITVLLEPLASSICNRFLGIPEIFEYADKTGIPNLKTLIDYRWFLAGGHAFSLLAKYADFIQHVHIDNPLSPFPKRIVPDIKDDHDYSPLFDALRKSCYKGIISIEANTTSDFKGDLRKGLELFAYYGVEPYKTIKGGID
jgi:sugar phosphate isomerase/epimerase